MALARYTKTCIDAVDPGLIGRFWAAALNLSWEPAADGPEGGVFGPSRQPVLWVNAVDEPIRAKNRVHLDIYARAIADLEALGATVVLPEGDDRRWTVMADPGGNEFCAFLRRPEPGEGTWHGLVVYAADPAGLAHWWVGLLGGTAVDQPIGYTEVSDVPGMTFTFDFIPEPEPRTVPSRVHWDVAAPALEPILAAGATVLRPADDEREWTVCADPEGNEFCVFLRPDAPD